VAQSVFGWKSWLTHCTRERRKEQPSGEKFLGVFGGALLQVISRIIETVDPENE
jgi:hypothetical protein